jgi:hypothetical protein
MQCIRLMLNFEKCKKILNQNDEFYSDDEIKQIMIFLDYWAKINVSVINQHLNEISNEKSSNNGSSEQ